MNHSKFVCGLILLTLIQIINGGACPTDQTKLIPNCESCDTTASNTICTKCLPSYFLSSNNCVSCGSVITNCNLCNLNIENNPVCYVCKTNYGLLNGGCQNCSAISGCSQCQILNYRLQCTTCNQGLILFSAEMTCISCQIPNCSNCSISNAGIYSCSACNNEYYLLNNTCLSCAGSISYCKTCLFDQNKRLTCTSCASNQLFLSNNSCLANCTKGGYSLCNTCQIVSLATNSMTCIDCKSGYYLDSNIKNCLPCSKVISGCSQCSTSNSSDSAVACSGCTQQYFLTSNPSNCVLCTTIKDKCKTCNFNFQANSGQCTSCQSGYFLNSTTLACDSCTGNPNVNATYPNNSCSICQNKNSLLYCLVCTSNYYLSGQTCIGCSNKIAKCDTCSQNTTFTCISCILGYILSSPNQCSLCNNLYPNCNYCNSNQCTDCLPGFYTLDNKKCLINCNVSNCKQCLTKDNTKCSICNNGYQTTYLYTCKMITCNFPLNFNGRQCICPFQSYYVSSSNSCQECNDNACQSCPSNNCQTCLDGYYLGNGGCTKCMANCRFCNSSDYCYQCDSNYHFVGGKCNQVTQMALQTAGIFYNNNFYQLCGFGCSECSSTACSACEIGYFLNGTSCYFCPSNCLYCNRSIVIVSSINADTGQMVNKTQEVITCIRCQFGLSLVDNTCLKCTDSYCVRCDFNINFCILCSISYTTDSNGICKSCAQNCNFCDNDGAGTCDDDSCFIGYTKTNKTSCVKCLGGCASCKTAYPFECIGCLLGTYSSASSNFTCLSCPQGCAQCSNELNCLACYPNYKLANGVCSSLCTLPCVSCNWSGNIQSCNQCLQGYTILNGACSPNFSCMSLNICEFCPLGYFAYRGQCYSCPSNCIQCIFVTQDPAFVISGSNYLPFVSCQRCNQSYYLDTTQSCKKCVVNCLYCSSAYSCDICASSYFLEYKLLNGINTINYSAGICTKCLQNCAQCANNPNRCTSCSYGSYLSDFTCRSVYNISFQVSLTSAGSNNATLFTSVISNLPTIFKEIIASLGSSFSQNKYLVTFNSIQNGSVIISGTADINNNKNDPSTIYNSASANSKQTTTIGTFQVASYALTANGFTPSATSTTTTDYLVYIIIGSCIGAVAVIGAILCLCMRARKQKEANPSDGQKFQTENNEPATSKNMLKSDNLFSKTVHQKNEISKKGKQKSKKVEVSHISGNRTNIMIPQKDQKNDKQSRRQIQLSKKSQTNDRNLSNNTKVASRQDEKISRAPQKQSYGRQKILQVQRQSSSKQRSKSRPKTSKNIQTQIIQRDNERYRSSNEIQIQHFESHSFRNQAGSNQNNKLKNQSNYEDDKKTEKKVSESEKQKKNAISRKYIPNQNTFFI